MAQVTTSLIERLIAEQKEERLLRGNYIPRTVEAKLEDFSQNKEIVVIKGIRRCGKSVLINKIGEQQTASDYYFNFEDQRLIAFKSEDFSYCTKRFCSAMAFKKFFTLMRFKIFQVENYLS